MKKMFIAMGILMTLVFGTQSSFAACPCSQVISPCPCAAVAPCPCPTVTLCPTCNHSPCTCNSCNSCSSCNKCCNSCGCNSCNSCLTGCAAPCQSNCGCNNCCREKCSWWKIFQNKNCCYKCNKCCDCCD